MTTQTDQGTVAKRLAQHCDPDHFYVVTTLNHKDYSDSCLVRIFGHSSKIGLVGLWHLLEQSELDELNIECHKVKGGGLILPKGHKQYHTVQALAVAVWRILGHEKYPQVTFL